MALRMKEAALKYLDLGFNVLPIRPDTKRPYVEWTIYQRERVEPHEVRLHIRHICPRHRLTGR
jgi:hypothetical protein